MIITRYDCSIKCSGGKKGRTNKNTEERRGGKMKESVFNL